MSYYSYNCVPKNKADTDNLPKKKLQKHPAMASFFNVYLNIIEQRTNLKK